MPSDDTSILFSALINYGKAHSESMGNIRIKSLVLFRILEPMPSSGPRAMLSSEKLDAIIRAKWHAIKFAIKGYQLAINGAISTGELAQAKSVYQDSGFFKLYVPVMVSPSLTKALTKGTSITDLSKNNPLCLLPTAVP
eukprot:15365543-Ditylum_brightwellii.AAC.1